MLVNHWHQIVAGADAKQQGIISILIAFILSLTFGCLTMMPNVTCKRYLSGQLK